MTGLQSSGRVSSALAVLLVFVWVGGCEPTSIPDPRPEPDGDAGAEDMGTPDTREDTGRDAGEAFRFEGIDRIEPTTVVADNPSEVTVRLDIEGTVPTRANNGGLEATVSGRGGDWSKNATVRGDSGTDAEGGRGAELTFTPPARTGRPGAIDLKVAIRGTEHVAKNGLRFRIDPQTLTTAAPPLANIPGVERVSQAWNVSAASSRDRLELLVLEPPASGAESSSCSVHHLLATPDSETKKEKVTTFGVERSHATSCAREKDHVKRGQVYRRSSSSWAGDSEFGTVLVEESQTGGEIEKTKLKMVRFSGGELPAPSTIHTFEAGERVVDVFATAQPYAWLGARNESEETRLGVVGLIAEEGAAGRQLTLFAKAPSGELVTRSVEGDFFERVETSTVRLPAPANSTKPGTESPDGSIVMTGLTQDPDTEDWSGIYYAKNYNRSISNAGTLSGPDVGGGSGDNTPNVPEFDPRLIDLDGDDVQDLVYAGQTNQGGFVAYTMGEHVAGATTGSTKFGFEKKVNKLLETDSFESALETVNSFRAVGEGDRRNIHFLAPVGRKTLKKGSLSSHVQQLGSKNDHSTRSNHRNIAVPDDEFGVESDQLPTAYPTSGGSGGGSFVVTTENDSQVVLNIVNGSVEHLGFDASSSISVDGEQVPARRILDVDTSTGVHHRMAVVARAGATRGWQSKETDSSATGRLAAGDPEIFVGICAVGSDNSAQLDTPFGLGSCALGSGVADGDERSWQWKRMHPPEGRTFAGEVEIAGVDSEGRLDVFAELASAENEELEICFERYKRASFESNSGSDSSGAETVSLGGRTDYDNLTMTRGRIVAHNDDVVSRGRLVQQDGTIPSSVELVKTGIGAALPEGTKIGEGQLHIEPVAADDDQACEARCDVPVGQFCECADTTGAVIVFDPVGASGDGGDTHTPRAFLPASPEAGPESERVVELDAPGDGVDDLDVFASSDPLSVHEIDDIFPEFYATGSPSGTDASEVYVFRPADPDSESGSGEDSGAPRPDNRLRMTSGKVKFFNEAEAEASADHPLCAGVPDNCPPVPASVGDLDGDTLVDFLRGGQVSGQVDQGRKSITLYSGLDTGGETFSGSAGSVLESSSEHHHQGGRNVLLTTGSAERPAPPVLLTPAKMYSVRVE